MSYGMKWVSVALLGLALLSTSAVADVNKGKKIYNKKLKVTCGFSSARFARMHTQDEWEMIKEAGKLGEEIRKICPGSQLPPRFEGDIYDFVYAYARDTNNIPS